MSAETANLFADIPPAQVMGILVNSGAAECATADYALINQPLI